MCPIIPKNVGKYLSDDNTIKLNNSRLKILLSMLWDYNIIKLNNSRLKILLSMLFKLGKAKVSS